MIRTAVFLALLFIFAPNPATAASSTGGQPGGMPDSDESAIRGLVERYLSTWTAKDIDGLSSCWTNNTPDNGVLLEAVTQTRARDFEFNDLAVTRVAAGADEATARVTVQVRMTNRATHEVEGVKWVKTFSFRRENGGWKIVREVSAVSDLLARLRMQSLPPERSRLLDDEPDLIGEELCRALSREADWILGKGKTAEGLGVLELAVEVARRAGGKPREADALVNLALRNRVAGNPEAALASYHKALMIYAAIPDESKMAAVETGLGGVYYQTHEFTTAAEHYRNAVKLYQANGDPDSEASAWHSLGNVAYMEGDWLLALEHYTKSVEIQERLAAVAGDRESAMRKQAVASAYHALGMVQQELGDYTAAETAYQTSLLRSTASGDRPSMARTHESLGTLYRLQHDFAGAVREYQVAVRLNEPDPGRTKDLARDARLFAGIGNAYAAEQRLPAALESLQRSLALYEQLKDEQGAATTLGALGAVYLAQRSYDPAIEHDRQALQRYDALHDQGAMALMRVRIGLVRSAQGQHEEALAEYVRALSWFETSKDQATRSAVLVLAAAEHAALGHIEEALDFVSKSVAAADASGSFDVISQGHLVAAEVYRRAGDMDQALREGREAITARERFRAAQPAGTDEAFFPDATPPYLAMVDVLAQRGRQVEAFDTAEQCRVVRFQERLGDGSIVTKGLTSEEQTSERRLRNQEQSLRRQVQLAGVQARPDLDPEQRASLDRALAAAVSARRRFEDVLYSSHPGLRQLRGRSEPGTHADAAALLDSRTALLAYTVTESRTYLFVLARDAVTPPDKVTTRRRLPQESGVIVRAYSIDITQTELQHRVLGLREILAQQTTVDAAARDLYDLLVKPAEVHLVGKRRLLVVPDGVLWAVPFQSLQSRDGHYVIEDYAVGYGQSLTALLAANGAQKSPVPATGSRLVAVGVDETDTNATEHLRSLRPDLRIEPLRYAEAESRGVVATLPPRLGLALTGREVRQGWPPEEARGARKLHVAVPCVLNDSSPLHSVIGMWSVPQSGERLIDTLDIIGLEQSARLVVLSRVYGEPGLTDPGAGAITMAWAWYVAGAPTTVYTQWLVDAPSTSALMSRFHSALSTPGTGGALRPSEALRSAILKLLRGPTAHPYFWAGITVLGDAQ
jgi:CHAT domain-containing protein/tetratricopeptide (TPR) repeat protein